MFKVEKGKRFLKSIWSLFHIYKNLYPIDNPKEYELGYEMRKGVATGLGCSSFHQKNPGEINTPLCFDPLFQLNNATP